MRKFIAAIALVMSVLAGFAVNVQPASAWTLAHIGTSTFPYSRDVARWVIVHDRLSDNNSKIGLVNYINAHNSLWSTYPAIPYFYYVDDDGGCPISNPSNAADVFICNGTPSGGHSNNEASSNVGYNVSDNHVTDAVVIARSGRSASYEYSIMCHELAAHVMNLEHNNQGDSCMQATLNFGEDDGLGYNAYDFQRLINFYYSHYPG